MKRLDSGWLLVHTLVLLSSGGALAQEASPAEAGVLPEGHRLTFYSRAGALVYLSDAMTTGGVGGGVGVRDTLHDRFILQADLNYLMVVGNAAALRLGAGLQRSGTYTPAVLLSLTTVVGDRLIFLTPEHPTPVRLPAMSLGLNVAPLRFTQGGMQLSVLEFGVGVGTNLPGLGVTWQLGLLEAGTSF